MTVVQQSGSAGVAAPGPVEREFTVRSRSQGQQILRRYRRNKVAMTALVGYVLLLAGSFLGPLWYRWSYSDLDGAALSRPPGSPGHPLGTEDIGRDLLALMMRGVQRSTFICVLFVLVAGLLGVLVGAAAGYYGGYVDNLLMRLVDLILTIPGLVLVIVVASKFPNVRSAFGVAMFIALFGWLPLARVVRGEFLPLREREFVEAAHALGASNRRIIVKHLLPNSLGPIIVWSTLGAATSVVAEAQLSYLGFGVTGSDTSLGRLVAEGTGAAETRPWLFYFPGLTMMVVVLSINLIGEGIREAFDPAQTHLRR